MQEIMLITAAGGFVGFVDIRPAPPTKLPDVVVWGERIFQRVGPHLDDLDLWIYREAYAEASLTKPERLKRLKDGGGSSR